MRWWETILKSKIPDLTSFREIILSVIIDFIFADLPDWLVLQPGNTSLRLSRQRSFVSIVTSQTVFLTSSSSPGNKINNLKNVPFYYTQFGKGAHLGREFIALYIVRAWLSSRLIFLARDFHLMTLFIKECCQVAESAKSASPPMAGERTKTQTREL